MTIRILTGDCRDVLKTLTAECADLRRQLAAGG